MSPKRGERYGRYTILKDLGFRDSNNGKYQYHYVLAKCDCGTVKEVRYNALRNGTIKSCGCLNREIVKNMHTKHGDCGTRLYNIWKDMRKRCENRNSTNYRNYGAKGISVCCEWHNWMSFKDWSLQNGYSDELSIDRINCDGNYEPSNCRWATRSVQNQNQKRNIKPFKAIDPNGNEYFGDQKTPFAKEHNLEPWGLYDCLNGKGVTHRGWKFTYL